MTKIFKISGLDCPNCALELEELITRIEGASNVRVDFIGQKVHVDCTTDVVYTAVVETINNFEEVKIIEEVASDKGERVNGKKVKIKNLCCANCGRELEEELNAIEGVSATVDFMNMQIVLHCNDSQAYDKAIYTITHFEDVEIVSDNSYKKVNVWRDFKKEVLSIALSVLLLIGAIIATYIGSNSIVCKIISYSLYAISFIAVGWNVLINTVKNLAKGLVFDENFLMVIASIGAFALGIISGDGMFEGVAVMLLYQIGELMQSIAVGSSRSSIARLMNLKSESATLIKDGLNIVVDPTDLHIGDTILIKVGEKVPVDCRIIGGQTYLNMSSLNGESMPREVVEGDEILSGAINLSAVVTAEVVREYEQSAVAKIIDLVENSTSKKAQPEKFITKFAKYYTPIVCICALLVATAIPSVICLIEGTFAWNIYSNWIYRALSFLVISCPCALVISVPLSYFSGIGRCAKKGILIKGSTYLDELSKAKIVVFDKTGTLTEGAFSVVSYTSEQALALATAAESYSNHPIAQAFSGIRTPYTAIEVKELAGFGIECIIDGKCTLVGNSKLMESYGIAIDNEQLSELTTNVYVAYDGAYVGCVGVDDKVRESAEKTITALKAIEISGIYMLTGDNKGKAENVCARLGIANFRHDLLPDDKLRIAEELKTQGRLIFVGDGINDAPVMTVADCAISLGTIGSDAAIEASDVVILGDDLSLITTGIKVAKKTSRIVKENIIGSISIKVGVMLLSVLLPTFPLIVSILADVGVMLLAVLNAMRA